jgi:hypothetical protein
MLPSKDLSINFVLPIFLPINAANISQRITIEKAIIAIVFGKTKTVKTAAIITQEAPLSTKDVLLSSCGRIKCPIIPCENDLKAGL